jgi:hypothetical protein
MMIRPTLPDTPNYTTLRGTIRAVGRGHGTSFSSIRSGARAVDGPDGQGARATGARICTILVSMARTVRANVDILKSCLPMGTGAANYKSEDFGRSPLFGQLFRQVSACLCILNGRAGDKEQ